MPRFLDPITVTPDEYERAVKRIIDAAGGSLVAYHSSHQQKVEAHDGEYVIDIVATFEALGAGFTVLVECKHHKRKVERSDVQVVHDKVRSIGAHKAMVFSLSGFQAGAIEYAEAHGIALVQFANGSTTWFAKGVEAPTTPPSSVKVPLYVGWWYHGKYISVLAEDEAKYTRQALGLEASDPS